MRRLLVCIDGSQYAQTCCEFAAWVSSKLDVEIEVVYFTDLRQFEVPFVADLSGSLGLQLFQAVMGQLQELEKEKSEVILAQAAVQLKESGYSNPVKRTHKTGFLVDSLKELEEGTDMIIVGKRGENANFATEDLGSTVERVARAATKPCFVASREFKEVSKVLISYDDGPSCRKAVDFVAESGMFSEAEIHLVTVSPNEEEEGRLKGLKNAEVSLADSGRSLTCQMLHGEAAPTVIDYVNAKEIKLLLMGAYGHNRIRQLILGSSTTELLQGCQIPTLLFR